MVTSRITSVFSGIGIEEVHSQCTELRSKGPEVWLQSGQVDFGPVTSLLCALVTVITYSVPTVCLGPIYYSHYFQFP